MSPLPALPPKRNVQVSDCAIAYYVAGPEDGPPLVLCHGLAAGALQFADDIDYFAAKGFRVIAPDLRGHGQSGLPKSNDGTAYAIARMAKDLLAMLDAESITKTNWVGNSLGGILALEIMGSAPERLDRVAIFGTAFALDLPALTAPGIGLGYAALGQKFLAWTTAKMTCPDKRAQAIVHATLLAAKPQAVKSIAAHVRKYDLTANAQKFQNPILMIRSDKDKAVNLALPKSIAAMAGKANFTRVDLADAGHCANLDQPEKFRHLVTDFFA